jgi:serine/threonine protein phosphatase PrpC
MAMAAECGKQEDVERGLAIIAHLFPEFEPWLKEIHFTIPLWERTLAVPLAARKLVQLENVVSETAPGVAYSILSDAQHIRSTPWRVTGGSRRGHSHMETGLNNQDAIRYATSNESGTVTLAVADGHGSDLSFRSDAGSRLAVNAAIEVLDRFAKAVSGASTRAVLDRARATLPAALTGSWRIAVKRHLEHNPFTVVEWTRLVAMEGWNGQKMINRRPELAYGTTILAVLATDTHIVCMQLGDGDILFVDTQGHCRRPIPKAQSGCNQTASLSRRRAAEELRIHVQDAIQELPALILAATDGYAESYKSDEEFLAVGRECLRLIGTEGFAGVDRRLRTFLDEKSFAGNGDDITIGFISRFDRHDEAVPSVPARMTAVSTKPRALGRVAQTD